MKTGEYERLVFTGKIDEHQFGILRPDFIGWEGGQPIVIDGGTKLAAGFSGFRGSSDLKIVQDAVAEVTSSRTP
jgi:glc operon protein GlcG